MNIQHGDDHESKFPSKCFVLGSIRIVTICVIKTDMFAGIGCIFTKRNENSENELSQNKSCKENQNPKSKPKKKAERRI